MDSPRKYTRRREQAAALIIVLALVVLATGLTVAYFSRATSDRPVAHSSFNQATVDQLAQSAMDNVIGDLRQEITNGSAPPSPTPNDSTSPFPFSLYLPTATSYMAPVRSPAPTPGTAPAIANLVRCSVRSDAIPFPARASRASAVNSTADVSGNGRSVALKRWNSHYLLPKYDPGSDDPTPPSPLPSPFNPNPPVASGFVPPDWVFVTAAGATPSPAAADVIGRYAYAIYDEGGLLDMNAAGFPSATTILQYGRKGSLALADLTALGNYGLSTTDINNIVGWRNYASARPSGTFPSFSFSTDSTNTYYNFILSDPNYIKLTNFLTNPDSLLTYSPIFFLTTAWQAPQNNNQTDQQLNTRQSLLKLRSALSGGGIGFVNALQYLGTSSREALASAPQWSPATPDSINPNFQALLVTSQFTRNDGSAAYVGDYLVNNRFLLQRLNWLTYKGPSATIANGGTRNAVPTSAPALGSPDYDLWLLTRPDGITFGLTSDFLQKGSAANILKYFGLVWDAANERWNYTSPSGGGLATSIAPLGNLTGTREPDFFELLQAGIINNSVGDSFSSNPALPTAHQASRMLHILSIGANIIAQSRVDSYPVRIACSVDVGGTPTVMEAVGIPRLPCIASMAACPVGASSGSGGGVNWFVVSNLWDPFRDTWDLTEAHAGNNSNGSNTIWLTPGYLRPPVRIMIKGNVVAGSATASQSGSVDPTSVTTFATTWTNLNASLILATGSNAFGRDGLVEALRLGTTDINDNTLTSFNPPTQSSTDSAWNSVSRPTNDTSNYYRTDNFVVFRLSMPGSSISAESFGKKPILIFQTGFQLEMEYQSPNGQWYPYSFLQGNNATNTWITATPGTSGLCLATSYSEYGTSGGKNLIVDAGTSNPTGWTLAALGQAPMFAKSDPRSIRYNSEIGVVSLASPPMSVTSAGIIGSIWPNLYATPPPMIPSAFPAPTPTPNPNPVTLGDNVLAGNGANPYNETSGNAWRPVMMNRPFRSVGEVGYAFRDQPFRTLSFSSTNSPDAGLLDLFTTVAYGVTPTPSPSPSISPTYPTPTVTPRGGVVSLNSLQAPSIAAMLAGTIMREDTPRVNSGPGQSPSPAPVSSPTANNVAISFVSSATPAPLVNRAGLADWIANLPDSTGMGPSSPKTQREAITRALGEVGQTRTWNLMLDVIAQSGRYPPNATSLQNGFVVDGEQRYWVHVAIDRFTGQVIHKQIETVNE